MRYPYAVLSDLHCHNHSAFASTNHLGINTRLQHVLDEIDRAAVAVLAAGGNLIVIVGDLFHQRGSIHPSVFNPVAAKIRSLRHRDITVLMIPGNHDLATKDTTELGNSFQSLLDPPHVQIFCEPMVVNDLAFIPWRHSIDDLRHDVNEIKGSFSAPELDLFIHAGINGVIMGLPDHGLDVAEVASWGFNRVFAGHYHNHKIMEGGRVISIGATTQQNWGDIGTKAGFLLVHQDRVQFMASHAPSFIEINETTDEAEIPLIVDGNYVRIRGLSLKNSEINGYRALLEGYGAKGVMFQIMRETVSARVGSSASKGLTLDESLDRFVDDMKLDDPAPVKSLCANILSNVRSIAV